MTYTLERLAPGSYDLLLDGEIVGSVVENVSPGRHGRGWYAELFNDEIDTPKPVPFTAPEHKFVSLGALRLWLGGAPIGFDAHGM